MWRCPPTEPNINREISQLLHNCKHISNSLALTQWPEPELELNLKLPNDLQHIDGLISISGTRSVLLVTICKSQILSSLIFFSVHTVLHRTLSGFFASSFIYICTCTKLVLGVWRAPVYLCDFISYSWALSMRSAMQNRFCYFINVFIIGKFFLFISHANLIYLFRSKWI